METQQKKNIAREKGPFFVFFTLTARRFFLFYVLAFFPPIGFYEMIHPRCTYGHGCDLPLILRRSTVCKSLMLFVCSSKALFLKSISNVLFV